MTVGEVVINESVQIDGKLDKVTDTQANKMVYVINTNGTQGLEPYSYAPADYPIPIITISGTGVGIFTDAFSLTFVEPSKGVVSNGNLSSTYSIGSYTETKQNLQTFNVTLNYTHSNGTCTVTYMTSHGNSRRLYSAIGNVSGNILSFSAKGYSGVEIRIVGIGF